MISQDALDLCKIPNNPGYIMSYMFKHLPKLIVVSQNMSEKVRSETCNRVSLKM